MWGILGHGCAADIDLRATVLEGRENDLDALTPALLLIAALTRTHQADIIGIGNSNIANAADNILGAIAVTTGSLAGQIGLQAGQPGFSFSAP